MRAVEGRGNAMDVVLSGVLAAVGESPSVACGPLQLLAGGVGAGLLALDGRVRQPGSGAPRPRGFVAGEEVPASATVAVPALPAAVAAAAAALGSMSLARLAGPAIELARARSPERASLLERIVRRGAQGLADAAVADEWIAVAGRSARGLLTREDLSSVVPPLVACSGPSAMGVLTVPWQAKVVMDSSSTHVVAACDSRGHFAIASYEARVDGLAIPGLGLVAPALAVPVMRGFSRVRPGEPRPASAPIALHEKGGVVDLALGVATTQNGEASVSALVRDFVDTSTMSNSDRICGDGQVVAVALIRSGAGVAGILASWPRSAHELARQPKGSSSRGLPPRGRLLHRLGEDLQGPAREVDAVTAGVFGDPELVDAADVTRGHVQGHEPLEFGHPDSAAAAPH